MKKLICILPITILICILLSSNNVFAYEYVGESPNIAVVHISTGQYTGWYCVCSNRWNNLRFDAVSNYIYGDGMYPNRNTGYNGRNTYQDAIDGMNSQGYLSTTSVSVNVDTVIMYKGTLTYTQGSSSDIVFGSTQEYEDYLNPPHDPNAWDTLWSIYNSIFGTDPADDSIFGYLRNWFDSDDDTDYQNAIVYPSLTPAPTPTPYPTAIPYSTTIVPYTDPSTGVTTYNYTYIYQDDGGNTITASAPPPQPSYPPSGGSNYVNPVNQNPVAVPTDQLNAFYQFAYDTNEHPNPEEYDPKEDLQDTMQVMDEGIHEYDEAIDILANSWNALPDEWLWIFGICTGIILIAGIISRFLGG